MILVVSRNTPYVSIKRNAARNGKMRHEMEKCGIEGGMWFMLVVEMKWARSSVHSRRDDRDRDTKTETRTETKTEKEKKKVIPCRSRRDTETETETQIK